ncbi:MAG TPA: hypothetical protein VGM84_10140 [Steroidobacteraceae bacterium]
MSDNRYAPPTAPVHDTIDPEPVRTRPREIVWAIQLAVAGYLLGLVAIIARWDYYSRLASPSPAITIVSQVLSLAVFVWFYAKIYAGRNWARITWLVLSLLGILIGFNQTFRSLINAAPFLVKANLVVGIVINLATAWLLFFSPGRLWFRRHP